MLNNSKSRSWKLILVTPFFIWLSHYLVVFFHEYAHALTAWLLGYKSNPFDINYGGLSLSNVLLLSNIDQKVNNSPIYAAGHPGHVALIAAAGPGLIILLFFLTYIVMQNKKVQRYPYFLYFILFFNLWCLGGTYAYVPVRTFTPYGNMVDVLDIEQALNISAWCIYFFIGYLVIFMMWIFFSKLLTLVFNRLNMTSTIGRVALMMTCVLLLFGYCGLAGFMNHGIISHFISVTSLFAIPGMTFLLWPTRKQEH